ncbi:MULTISPECIES: phosphatase PAP2 family protein [Cytobacillus]|uniref:Phosphatase PAP2 family protein n=1 Tax=Cytobacillus stercorigallinarum TaxID=2762240 RepID=A0ABR8QL74_9BACI|nr:phosphatase PAP2 family protein [Cytobacillus stercorigallinarum]MBD7936268.1 phosphatase PAP2 family protein [Cytobacillus stercorigallinarum]
MKKPTVYITTNIILFILFLSLFLFIVFDYTTNDLAWFDMEVIHIVQQNITPTLTTMIDRFTFLGSVRWIAAAVLIVMVLLVLKKKYALAIYISLASGVGALLNWSLKHYFKRERPAILPLIEETGYAFPSGHSMGSFIFYGSLAFVIIHLTKRTSMKWAVAIIMGLLIFAIGLSRIYLGVHYPSDVAAGFLVGAIWLMLTIMVFHLYEHFSNK